MNYLRRQVWNVYNESHRVKQREIVEISVPNALIPIDSLIYLIYHANATRTLNDKVKILSLMEMIPSTFILGEMKVQKNFLLKFIYRAKISIV